MAIHIVGEWGLGGETTLPCRTPGLSSGLEQKCLSFFYSRATQAAVWIPTRDAVVLSHPPAVREEQLVPGLCRGLPGPVPALPGARTAAAGPGGPGAPSPRTCCTKSPRLFVKLLQACASRGPLAQLCQEHSRNVLREALG